MFWHFIYVQQIRLKKSKVGPFYTGRVKTKFLCFHYCVEKLSIVFSAMFSWTTWSVLVSFKMQCHAQHISLRALSSRQLLPRGYKKLGERTLYKKSTEKGHELYDDICWVFREDKEVFWILNLSWICFGSKS